jgi:hypothetical protein
MDAVEGMVLGDGAAFIEGLAQFFIVTQLVTLLVLTALLCGSERAYLFGATRRRRAFRCPLRRREVEVEFEERRFFGVRHSAAVKRCSAFEVATAIGCRRPCVNSSFRRQWEFPLPVSVRAESQP